MWGGGGVEREVEDRGREEWRECGRGGGSGRERKEGEGARKMGIEREKGVEREGERWV